MEAVGLAMSVATLAGLFQNVVLCFQYVQLGKSSDTDFKTTCLRFENARLRLSRWGQALGLDAETYDNASLQASVSIQDLEQATDLLNQIDSLVKRANEVSDKFRVERCKPHLVEIQDALTPRMRSSRQRMRDICLGRQDDIGRTKKARWALTEKERLNNLVSDLENLVGSLIELFPAPAQEQLRDQEVANMHDRDVLPPLSDIPVRQDGPLSTAIGKFHQHQTATLCTWKNSDNTKVVNHIAGNQTLYGGQTFSL